MGSSQVTARASELLSAALTERGLVPDPRLVPALQRRARFLGTAEWNRFLRSTPLGIGATHAIQLLGSGYTLVEFLAAPAAARISDRLHACSLGALLNLTIVVCDRLLDMGERVENVLPRSEIPRGGGSSIVTNLMRLYHHRLAERELDDERLGSLEKLISQMFDAEIQTVHFGEHLPYPFWLRKCSLPVVLMGLPAWREGKRRASKLYQWHVRWLFRLGRFFGQLDDAVDLEDDLRSGEPNSWRALGREIPPSAVHRIACSASKLLSEWDGFVDKTSESTVFRETFLHILWGSLVPAGLHTHAD